MNKHKGLVLISSSLKSRKEAASLLSDSGRARRDKLAVLEQQQQSIAAYKGGGMRRAEWLKDGE